MISTYILALGITGVSVNDNLASIQVQRPGTIKSVRFAVTHDSVTDNASIHVEVSKSPVTSSNATSFNTSVIAMAASRSNFVTSGLSTGGINHQVMVNKPVGLGEILYINVAGTGTNAVSGSVLVDVEDK